MLSIFSNMYHVPSRLISKIQVLSLLMRQQRDESLRGVPSLSFEKSLLEESLLVIGLVLKIRQSRKLSMLEELLVSRPFPCRAPIRCPFASQSISLNNSCFVPPSGYVDAEYD